MIILVIFSILLFTGIGRFILGNLVLRIGTIITMIFSSMTSVFVIILVLTLLRKGLL